ncbi:hypothetical protein [Bacteroides zoogleoformans]|uniref:hypothetical protein n=1 Tax=Bacteroides zoogleoformans TaxID=28119 RepID=UPI00101AECA5|nr:hypothetical protein [Bacteroides zoogleoformans]
MKIIFSSLIDSTFAVWTENRGNFMPRLSPRTADFPVCAARLPRRRKYDGAPGSVLSPAAETDYLRAWKRR